MTECRSVGLRGPRGTWRLAEVCVRARAGEVVGIVGDRSDRATLMAVWAGCRRPHRGRVVVSGPAFVVPDPPLIPGELTGEEWLRYVAARTAPSPRDRDLVVRQVLDTAALGATVRTRVSGWPLSDVRILSIATALGVSNGPVFLTEALEGIGFERIAALRRYLWRVAPGPIIISGEGETLDLVTDRTLVMQGGRLAHDADTVTVRRGRVLELDVATPAFSDLGVLLTGIPGAQRTDRGARIPLTEDWTSVRVLEACRARGIPVRGSNVRQMRWADVASMRSPV